MREFLAAARDFPFHIAAEALGHEFMQVHIGLPGIVQGERLGDLVPGRQMHIAIHRIEIGVGVAKLSGPGLVALAENFVEICLDDHALGLKQSFYHPASHEVARHLFP